MNNTTKLALAALVLVGAFALFTNKETDTETISPEDIEREAVVDTKVAATKYGDFEAFATLSAKKVEVGQSFTVTFTVTDMTPDLINAIASGDPAEYERYKRPWTLDGAIEVDGPAAPGIVYIWEEKAEQKTDPEDVPYGSVFTRSGTFTCNDTGFVHVDVDYLIERGLEDGVPPLDPTLERPGATEDYLYLGTVRCVEPQKKPAQPEMVQIPPPIMSICPDGTSLSGQPLYDIETIEPIRDSVGNYIDRETGQSIVCPGGEVGSLPPEAGTGFQTVGERPEGAR